ncbi:MAG: four helix bundle protein [Pseudomonadota bacterium]
MKIASYKELKIWQEGIEVVKFIYKLSSKFPREELYGLCSQMRRSAISIPSNIAEGFKRFHAKEYTQFLNVSRGSIAELETQLIIAKDLGFCSGTNIGPIFEKLEGISKMTTALIKKLRGGE